MLCVPLSGADEELDVVITKIDKDQVSFKQAFKDNKRIPTPVRELPEVTLPISKNLKVHSGIRDQEKGTLSKGAEIPAGLDYESFKHIGERNRRSFLARLITTSTGEKKTVTEIWEFPESVIPTGKGKVEKPVALKVGPGLSKPDADKYEYVMSKMKEGRERHKAGIFRANGLRSQKFGQEDQDFRGQAEFYGAFDSAAGLFRFDSGIQEQFGPPSRPSGVELRKPLEFRRKQIILRPDSVLIATPATKQVNIYAPGQLPSVDAFDVRCLGLLTVGDLSSYQSFGDSWKMLKDLEPAGIGQEPDGKWKIVWDSMIAGTRVQRILWIDGSRGFTVSRSETRHPIGEAGSTLPDVANYQSEVAWELREGVWVPIKFKIFRGAGHATTSFDLSFQWESINRPVPELLFTKDDFATEPRTFLIDNRGKPGPGKSRER